MYTRSDLLICKIWFGIFIKLLNRHFKISRVGDDIEYPLELCTQNMYIKTSSYIPPNAHHVYFIIFIYIYMPRRIIASDLPYISRYEKYVINFI